MSVYTEIDRCRICSANLEEILNLGEQAIASRFPKEGEADPPVAPLVLCICTGACKLVQLKHTVRPSELYTKEYGYRSGINSTMKTHLNRLVMEIQEIVDLNEDDIVLDIGSNDCTLLKYYTKGRRMGIDPTGLQFAEHYPRHIFLNPVFFSRAEYDKMSKERARVVTAIAMFYDLPDPLQFCKDISNILRDDGIFVIEQSYLGTMIEQNAFDGICHEHLEYYSLYQIEYMAERSNLKILAVSKNECNGGSFRVVLAKKNSSVKENRKSIDLFLEEERRLCLGERETYIKFMKRCTEIKNDLVRFLVNQKIRGKSVYVYGASTKGNTLLQYFGINCNLVSAAVERNPAKFGCRTPFTNITIISEKEMRRENPDFLLVLPWHFREEFLSREKEYLEKGGQYIFPLPKLEIVCGKRVALITGISGQIGQHIYPMLLKRGYIVYGQTRDISKCKTVLNDLFYYESRIDSAEEVDRMIKMIQPDEIYHLAAETNAVTSTEQRLQSLYLNGNIVARICESIHEMKTECHLICANSSELYKGSNFTRAVTEEDLNFRPVNPYGIGKLMAYWTCRYYRERYGMNVSSAILFNIESPLRKESYVTQKIIKGVSRGETVLLGNIESSRDWTHASDAAEALICIAEAVEASDDYIVSSGESHTIRELVQNVCDLKRIRIEWRQTEESEEAVTPEGQVIVRAERNKKREYDRRTGPEERLVGDNSKLKLIGWRPKYNYFSLLVDMCK